MKGVFNSMMMKMDDELVRQSHLLSGKEHLAHLARAGILKKILPCCMSKYAIVRSVLGARLVGVSEIRWSGRRQVYHKPALLLTFECVYKKTTCSIGTPSREALISFFLARYYPSVVLARTTTNTESLSTPFKNRFSPDAAMREQLERSVRREQRIRETKGPATHSSCCTRERRCYLISLSNLSTRCCDCEPGSSARMTMFAPILTTQINSKTTTTEDHHQ
jgi:hypothetical protein